MEIVERNISGLKIASRCFDHDLVILVSQLLQLDPALLPEVKVLLLKLPDFDPCQVSLTFHVDRELLNPTVVSHLEPEVEADAVVLHNLQFDHIIHLCLVGQCRKSQRQHLI